MKNIKVGIVVQRYGEAVCGGGEYYAKQLAEHLAKLYTVEVITTTSVDYLSWDNYYKAGSEYINDVKVTRFKPEHERNWDKFNEISRKQVVNINNHYQTSVDNDNLWVDEEGPYCPSMISYLTEKKDDYDVIFVITYIYYNAIRAIPIIKEKCVFIPTAHDEVWIRMTLFKKIFHMPRYFAFLTEGESCFVRNFFHNNYIPSKIVGFGVDVPKDVDPNRFKAKFNINSPYVVYVGRIDISKNCDQMISYFLEYKKRYKGDLKLVLIGNNILDKVKHPDIIYTGFVTESEKFDGITGAEAMICPSKYESLCIALLEGMACGKPVLVNGECEILNQQCKRSEAGLAYFNKEDFINSLKTIIKNRFIYNKMSSNAFDFIAKNYTWEIVTDKFVNIINHVINDSVYLDRNVLKSKVEKDLVIKLEGKEDLVEPAFSDDATTVCLISSNQYAPICGVTLNSIIENANKNVNYDILIFCSDISDYNIKLLKSLIKGYANISLRFVNLKNIVKKYKYKLASYYNEFTYYRLFIPYVLTKYNKVLYLDSDIVVNHDISELYNIDIDDYFIAAARELTVLCWQLQDSDEPMRRYLDELGLNKVGEYIQGGVALYNVKKIKKELPIEELNRIATEKEFLMADQDIINIYCKDKIYYLHNKWNVVNLDLNDYFQQEMYNRLLPTKYFDEYIESRENPYIVHYSGQRIPCFDMNVDLYHYFWMYARNTPYYELLLNYSANEKINKLKETIVSSHIGGGSPNEFSLYNKILDFGNVKRIVNKVFPKNTTRRKLVKKFVKKIIK